MNFSRRFFVDIAAPAILVAWIALTVSGALFGPSGLTTLRALAIERDAARSELRDLARKRMVLERRADQLNARSLNPDLLDEKIRAVLGYTAEGELIVPAPEVRRLLEAAEARKP